MKQQTLILSLFLAAGIILSTIIATLTSEWGWLVLAGPLVMALTLVGVSLYGRRRRWLRSGVVLLALFLGGTFLLASAVVAATNPGHVETLMPILGGGTAGFIITSLTRESNCPADVL